MNQNIVCWFEIYVKDMSRAKKFYNAVLGTQFIDMAPPGEADNDLKMAFFSSPENQGVSGALVQATGTKEGDGRSINTMVYFPCKDTAIEEARVVAAGGSVFQSKMSIGEFGFCSMCIDTEGNAFGLFSME